MVQRIVCFMDNYASLGGAAHTLLRQMLLMKHMGKDVHVAVSKYGCGQVCPEYLSICSKAGISVYELGFSVSNQPEGIDIFSVLESYERVRDFLKSQKPDIVHSVQLNPVVELACRELAIAHVMNIYQALPQFFVFRYPDIFPHYHICDSQFYAGFWNKYFGTESYCVRTVAGKMERSRHSLEKEDLRFICVGLICERKNQMEVIRAFELSMQSGVKGKLELWGRDDMDYARKCRQYINDHHLQNDVTLMGYTTSMEAIYKKSDALICGSISESYPNVISEALAGGVVVISTPVAGVPEVIKDRTNGYLCRGYDGEALSEGICAFYRDSGTAAIKRIQENADSTYEHFHAEKSVSEELAYTYEKIVDKQCTGTKSSYGILELTQDFRPVIERYIKNEHEILNTDFVRMNLWKIQLVIQKISLIIEKTDKQLYVWGTGKYGALYKQILDIFAPDIKIDGFIDSYKTGRYLDYEIFPEKDIFTDKKNIILVGVLDNRDIVKILESYGYIYGYDYFHFQPLPW